MKYRPKSSRSRRNNEEKTPPNPAKLLGDDILGYLGFTVDKFGNVDVAVMFGEENEQTVEKLSALLAAVNVGGLMTDIYKIMLARANENELERPFIQKVIASWVIKHKLIKGSGRYIKPSQVFAGIRQQMGREELED